MVFLILTLLSAVILFGFIGVGLGRYGLLHSYSAYSAKWLNDVPQIALWAYITIIAAFLVVPPLIEVGAGSALQFLGFLTPVYLIVVGLTPRWQSNDTEYIVHSIFAGLCAVGAILWSIFVAHTWVYLVCSTVAVLLIALLTGTLKKGLTFYLEMIAFFAVYVSLIAIFT